MLQLLPSPFFPKLQAFIENLSDSCLICSPYLSLGPVKRLVEVVERKGHQNTLDLKLITDISAANLVAGSTDITALLLLAERISNLEITYLPRIHAKVYISGASFAIVSSANFTDAGCLGNLEYGVSLSDVNVVNKIRTDIERYASLGAVVGIERLIKLKSRVDELQAVVKQEQKSINKRLRSLSRELQRQTEDDLIRVRVQNRTVNAIFADTIAYLLSKRPMSTIELHEHIHQIHPDLCDDSMDRIIDGEHYGKLWKHQVRNAQQHLKSKGVIGYNRTGRIWESLS